MKPDISIVTSTFNPEERVLGRCLHAISRLKRDGLVFEYFLVDNNSDNPIEEHPYVQEFLKENSWARLLKESEPGASYGKMCGFRAGSAPLVVFFDDDNEPDADYLLAALDYSKRKPQVAAFGPGVVKVEYIDPVDDWLNDYKGIFQEAEKQKEEQSCNTEDFEPYYPIGTGLVMKRTAVEPYAKMLANGEIKTTCRKGNSLSSAGDLQMVFIALKNGFEAGTSPTLRLKHLISARKANRSYIRKLTYGCATSSLQARVEVFPEEKEFYRSHIISSAKAVVILGMIAAKNLFSKDLDLRIAEQIGSVHGYRDFFELERPRFTVWVAKRLGLE
jgi:glycosyltransferase involved in cell wall biosynthesis